MKRFLKIFVPILLTLCIIAGIIWYVFFYDKGFTQDVLLSGARFFREQEHLSVSSWFYDRAYEQGINQDDIAIEKAQQFTERGNYTQAEITLTNAIKCGGGSKVYIALSDVFVKQDKLLDATQLLDQISDPGIKSELDLLRPDAPTASMPADTTYDELISVSIKADNTLFVSTNGQFPSMETDGYTGTIDLKEGVNTIQAISVSANGLVSPLATYQYIIVGIVEEIQITDASMEQAIRTGLGLSQRQTILTSDLWKINQFTIPEGASDYSPLQYMLYLETLSVESGVNGQFTFLKNAKGLKSLSITKTSLSTEDMDTIGSLSSLESLTLDSCSIPSSAPLSNLISLKHLNLNNTVAGSSAFSSMTELTELYLHSSGIRELSSLANCKKLEKLDISNNSITSIAALSDLKELTYLDINSNQISDISVLSSYPKLKELRANNNQISDLSALASASELEHLNVSNNLLTDINILSSLQKITYLNFAHNQVKKLPQFSKGCKLITIDGSYNQLTSLDDLAELLNLNNILMDYNEGIKSVAGLEYCPVLIQVNIYGTKVTDVSMLKEHDIIVNYNPTEGL